jgi:hypothetical protein
MGDVLAIVALAVLVGLVVLSAKRQRAGAASEKQEAKVRSNVGTAQHERSTARLTAARSAHDQAQMEPSPIESPGADPRTVE